MAGYFLVATTALDGSASQGRPSAIFEPLSTGMTYYDAKPSRQTRSADRAAFRAAFKVGADVARVRRDGLDYEFAPIALVELGGARVALLSGGHMRSAGHASTGLNTIHYLERSPSGYQVQSEWFDRGMPSEFGQPAERWAFARVRGFSPIFYTEGRSTYQGCDSSSATLTELLPSGAHDFVTFPVFYSDDGMLLDKSKVTTLTATIVALNKRGLTVRYDGSRQFKQRYERRGRIYQLVGRDRVPEC